MGLIKAYKGQLRRAVERKLAIPRGDTGVTRGWPEEVMRSCLVTRTHD